MRLLTELNPESTTIVMVTHSEHDALITNRVTNLFDGRVAWTFYPPHSLVPVARSGVGYLLLHRSVSDKKKRGWCRTLQPH